MVLIWGEIYMEFIWVIVGIFSAIVILGFIYPLQMYLKMRANKKKIENILVQIRGQVSIKHSLLKEYIEINKDVIEEDKYNDMIESINHYSSKKSLDIDVLKDFNNYYSYCMKSFDDTLLIHQCNESEEKINYIKDYYNELVDSYNRYKSNGVNLVISKAMSIEDAKLY